MCTRPFTSLDWDSWHIWGFWRLKTKTEHLTHSTSSKHDWHTLRKLLKLSRIDFPGSAGAKDPASQCTRHSRDGFDSWVGKIAWKREWQPTSVFLSGEFHGQRSLAGYSPWGRKESNTTEWLILSLHFLLTCISGIQYLGLWMWQNHHGNISIFVGSWLME